MTTKKILVFFFLILGIVSMRTSHVYAETIVHLERTRYSQPEHRNNHETNKHVNASSKSDTQEKTSNNKETNINETNNDKKTNEKPPTESLDSQSSLPVKEKKEKKYNIIENNAYFRNFTVEGPKVSFSNGSGGDVLGTSSIIYYSSLYRLELGSEYVTFSLQRQRLATALGSDTSSLFFVAYDLKFNPHASKKRTPKIEILNGTKPKIIEFKKISEYNSDGFIIHTGDDSFLEAFYYPGCDANLLLENKDGEILRVPLPAEVIEQWHQVCNADLRKIKKEYEDA